MEDAKFIFINLDGAIAVVYDENEELAAANFGGRTVQIYDAQTGKEIDCFTLEDLLPSDCSVNVLRSHFEEYIDGNK